jgi:hypothetical protein
MTQSTKLLTRTGITIVVVSLVYFAPLVFASTHCRDQVPQLNTITMNQSYEHNLDGVTRHFLDTIEDASNLHDAHYFSMHEEIMLRVRLRDAFDGYFAALIPLEAEYGPELTEHSREVIQMTIEEFIELDSERGRSTEVAVDLDAYSKVMTESLINTVMNV